MQNTIQKFRQSSIAFDELQLSYSSIFFAKTLHTFSTYQWLQKGVWDFFISFSFFFFFNFRSWVICKNLKGSDFYKLGFYTSINSSRSKQNKKKIPHTLL